MDPARAKRSSWLNDQRVRGLVYQTLLLAGIAALAGSAIYNAVINMRARGIPMGFGFWNDVAGFDINLHLINYSNLSTYGRAFWVGLLNTLLIGVICIPLATLLGFVIGVARLSPNWLLSRFALVYTSLMRNTPLLLLLLFWYNAVLKSLPGPRQSISVGDVVFLNNRGLYLPMPVARESVVWFLGAVACGRRPCDRISCVGAAATGADRRAIAERARRRRAHRRTARAGDSCVRGAFRVRYCSAFRLQSQRWTSGCSRNGRARVRACHIHRRLHRGDCSRRRFGGAVWSERGGWRAWLTSGPFDEAGGHPAGDATDNAAAHFAISKHRQEFLACRVYRLSGPRADFRRHGSQPDAGGGAGDGDHHGGLSGHLACGRPGA